MTGKILPFRARAPRARLRQAQQQHELVRVWRGELEHGSFCGYVAGVGREFFLLRVIGDGLTDEGLYAMRHRDVTELEAPEAHHHFIEQALAIKHIVPHLPTAFPLDAVNDVVAAAAQRVPVMGVHVDSEEDAEVCYIGRLVDSDAEGFQLQEIDLDARWLDEPSFFAWDEVSTLSMHDPYAQSLLAVAGNAPPLKQVDDNDGGRDHGS
ncbi:MAG TPA: hypothetical protein VFL78_10920 [Rhodanobacteraceae bacterium]|nr:hypothetical protein [Rhodanobacteraceae bacterium]